MPGLTVRESTGRHADADFSVLVCVPGAACGNIQTPSIDGADGLLRKLRTPIDSCRQIS